MYACLVLHDKMQPLCLVNNIYQSIWSLENLNPKPQPNFPGKTDPTFGMQNRPRIRPCVLGIRETKIGPYREWQQKEEKINNSGAKEEKKALISSLQSFSCWSSALSCSILSPIDLCKAPLSDSSNLAIKPSYASSTTFTAALALSASSSK